MDYTSVIYAVLSMGGLGLFFALLIALADKKLKVEEDPRVSKIDELLPGANCGACGLPGCNACAYAMVKGDVLVSVCPVCDEENQQEIAKLLGVEVDAGERKVAVVLCQGGKSNVTIKADYEGVATCLGTSIVSGGDKACEYGCLGSGDCVSVCTFDAIYMGEEGLPLVNREKCTGCGQCAVVCPRNIIEMHNISSRVFVLCKNHDKGKDAKAACKTACIGCSICVKKDESGGFSINNFLASVDHNKYGNNSELPTDKCPTKAIVVIGKDGEK
jgi:electron transport complex protein RnfB